MSQDLVKTVDGKLAAAIEILLGTPLVQDLIRRGDVPEIKAVMEKSGYPGLQTFDRALFRLVEPGRLGLDEALKNTDPPDNLRLNLSLSEEQLAVEKHPPASA